MPLEQGIDAQAPFGRALQPGRMRGAVDAHAGVQQGYQLRAESFAVAQALEAQRARHLESHHVLLQLDQFVEVLRHGHVLAAVAVAGQRLRGLFPGFLGVGIRLGPGRRGEQADAQGAVLVGFEQPQVAGEHGTQQGHVAHVPAEATDHVHRGREAFHPGADHAAQAGLVAHHAAVGGRADDGAGRLRAQGQRHHVVGHSGGRAAGRAARCVQGVVRVDGRARREVGEFGGHGLAQHHGAGLAAQRHTGGISCWAMVGINGRAVGRGQVAGVKDVLHAEGQAVQRAAHGAGIERAGLGQGRDGVQVHEGVDVVVARGHAFQAGAHQVFGLEFAPCQQGGGLGGAEFVQLGGGHSVFLVILVAEW